MITSASIASVTSNKLIFIYFNNFPIV